MSMISLDASKLVNVQTYTDSLLWVEHLSGVYLCFKQDSYDFYKKERELGSIPCIEKERSKVTNTVL